MILTLSNPMSNWCKWSRTIIVKKRTNIMNPNKTNFNRKRNNRTPQNHCLGFNLGFIAKKTTNIRNKDIPMTNSSNSKKDNKTLQNHCLGFNRPQIW